MNTETKNRVVKWLGAGAVVSLALVGAGCGDDKGDDRLSASAFRERAGGICGEVARYLEERGTAVYESNPSPDDLTAFFVEDVVPSMDRQFRALAALRPPLDIAPQVDALVQTAQLRLADIDRLAHEDPQGLFEGTVDPFDDVEAQAEALGVSVCAGGDQ